MEAICDYQCNAAFLKPKTGRTAVKVLNHLGDEVMKVFGVG
jgi:adenine-specific DNA-methyltransferase